MLKLKVPPVVVFFFALGVQWFVHRRLPAIEFSLPGQTVFALAILAFAGLIGIAGVWHFVKKGTTVNPHKPEHTKNLVTGGVYGFSRNPMYLALAIGLCAPVVYLGNALTLLVIPLFIWYMNAFQIKPEESIMKEKFGREFEEYRANVRRWI